MIELCSIPPFSKLFNSSKTNKVKWDAIQSFEQGTNQPSESFMEQKEAISINVQSINEYMDIFGNTGGQFIKYIGLHGAPGNGKSFVTIDSCVHAISIGLRVTSASIMSRRFVHLGGLQFSIDVNNYMSPQRWQSYHLLKTISNSLQVENITFLDEGGQMSAELLSSY